MADKGKARHILLTFQVLAQKPLLSGNFPGSLVQAKCPYFVYRAPAFITLFHYTIITLLCLHFHNKTTVSSAPSTLPGTSGALVSPS